MHDGKWFTHDNRRLWLFRHLERLGKHESLEVEEIDTIDGSRLTTNTEGVSIIVRGEPGGTWHSRESVKTSPVTLIRIHTVQADLQYKPMRYRHRRRRRNYFY